MSASPAQKIWPEFLSRTKYCIDALPANYIQLMHDFIQ